MGKSAVQEKPAIRAAAEQPEEIGSGRERLQFAEFDYEPYADGSCVSSIVLEWEGGQRFRGRAEGTQTPQGELRCGALAAVAAAEEAADDKIAFSLVGVKAVRAFDNWVIIVAVRGKAGDADHRLIGAYATQGDQTARAAAMSVLDATNRVLVKYLSRKQ